MDEGIALFVLLNSWAIAVLSPTTQLDRSYLPPGNRKLTPIHPGEILLEEFIKPMGLSQNRIGMDMRVPPRRINEIVQAKRRITPDTALRLALYYVSAVLAWVTNGL